MEAVANRKATGVISGKKPETRTKRTSKLLLFYLRQGGRLGPFLVFLIAGVFAIESSQLSMGTLEEPGPGMWPMALSIITMALSLLAATIVPQVPQVLRKKGAVRVLIYLVALILFIPLYGVIGFIPAGVLFCFTLLKVVGKEGWLLSLVLSLITAVAVYAIFGFFLGLPINPWF